MTQGVNHWSSNNGGVEYFLLGDFEGCFMGICFGDSDRTN